MGIRRLADVNKAAGVRLVSEILKFHFFMGEMDGEPITLKISMYLKLLQLCWIQALGSGYVTRRMWHWQT